MKHFTVSYTSGNNLFTGILHVEACTIAEAQDKFLNWLIKQPTYAHMWQLSFEFKEIGNIE